MAATDDLKIVVHGRSTHGAQPWNGVDPITVASQIVMGLQTIVSRQTDLTKAPVVLTIGRIEGGLRFNIIPDAVTLYGTVRTLDPSARTDVEQRIKRTAENIAAASGASAEVSMGGEVSYPVTFNDPALTAQMLPTLARVAGKDHLLECPAQTIAEDFSFYQQKIPGFSCSWGCASRARAWRNTHRITRRASRLTRAASSWVCGCSRT